MIAMRKKDRKEVRAYEPTPKDIRRACEQIQATWSPRERAKRTGRPRGAWWTPPHIRLSSITEAASELQLDSPLCWGGPVDHDGPG